MGDREEGLRHYMRVMGEEEGCSLPVIKGFTVGLAQSPYGKLIKDDQKREQRMEELQEQFELVGGLNSDPKADEIHGRDERVGETTGKRRKLRN